MREKLLLNKNLLETYSNVISIHLSQLLNQLNSDLYSNGFCLGTYSPLKNEPIWWSSLKGNEFRDLAVVHMHDETKLSYHTANLDSFKRNEYQLKLAEKSIEVEPDVLLIPGMAFDENFERLGRGKGYFDSYLEEFKGIKIGICFSFQLLKEVPKEKHDKSMDYIITDKKIYKRG